MRLQLLAALALGGVLALGTDAPTGFLVAEANAQGSPVECRMTYSLSGWSIFYKTASGSGTIRCTNGQTAKVAIRAKGGGITFGKTEVVRGTGDFTGVHDIQDVFGSYAQAEAHAGVGKSADAQVLTKGGVSLALAGKGHGINLGVDFGKFTIQRAK